MGLELIVRRWTLKNEQATLRFMDRIIRQHTGTYGQEPPPAAMVLGDNWVYIAFSRYSGGLQKPQPSSVTNGRIFGSEKSILLGKITDDYIPLAEILQLLESIDARIEIGHIKAEIDVLPDGLAVIPLSEERKSEVRGLGSIVYEHDDWFRISWDGKTVTVLPVSSADAAGNRSRVAQFIVMLYELLHPYSRNAI